MILYLIQDTPLIFITADLSTKILNCCYCSFLPSGQSAGLMRKKKSVKVRNKGEDRGHWRNPTLHYMANQSLNVLIESRPRAELGKNKAVPLHQSVCQKDWVKTEFKESQLDLNFVSLPFKGVERQRKTRGNHRAKNKNKLQSNFLL